MGEKCTEYLVIVAKLAGDNQVRVHDSHMVSRFPNMLKLDL